MKKTTLSVFLAVLLAFAAFGQVNTITPTTLSAAVGYSDTVITVASASSFSAPTNGGPGSYVLIDSEIMSVQSISSTSITVTRGVGGIRSGHVTSTTTWAAAPNLFYSSNPAGTCITAQLFVYPYINSRTGEVWACYGSDRTGTKTGEWRLMLNGYSTPFGATAGLDRYANIAFGGVAWSGVGTTLSPTTTVTYVASIDLPVGKLVTGVSYLAGTTNSGTPHATVALYGPNGGTPLAYSATTAVTATASIWEDVPFTSTIWLPPGRYFIGIQADASTTHITTLNTGLQPINLVTTSITGGTYGTIANVALTAPTTFTTAVGPIAALY
jgi:hypothetical protein